MSSSSVTGFFHQESSAVTYVVHDPRSRDAVIIDPVLDYDAFASQTSTMFADEVLHFIRSRDLNVQAILDTHAHADHITGARYLAKKLLVPVGIGKDISRVQAAFSRILGFDGEVKTDGSQFDLLLEGGRSYEFGSLSFKALSTPGHTPACLSYLVGDAVFTGDALFMEDYGTGRTDFPEGSSADLYRSVHETLYSLPEDTRVFVGHDYQPGGRDVAFESTIGTPKAKNVQLSAKTQQQQFIAFRDQRDSQLRAPKLLYQSVQVNAYGGTLPGEAPNGIRYLRLPLNARRPSDEVGDEGTPNPRLREAQ